MFIIIGCPDPLPNEKQLFHVSEDIWGPFATEQEAIDHTCILGSVEHSDIWIGYKEYSFVVRQVLSMPQG